MPGTIRRRHHHASIVDTIARHVFHEVRPAMRRKHLRFLVLSAVLGLLFCAQLMWGLRGLQV